MRGLLALALLVVAGGFAAWLLFSMDRKLPPTPAVSQQLPRTEKEFRDQLTLLRMKKEKLERSIERVENQKLETVGYLRERGVVSTADVRGKSDLEYAARNLQGWTEQLNALRADVGKYDRAIAAIMTMLDEFDRRRINESVAISEEEWIRMQSIVKDLDETLGMDPNDILRDDELNSLLRKELGADPPATGGGDGGQGPSGSK